MSKGEYIEKLESGGELVVRDSTIEIRYFFEGPDLRYHYEHICVPYERFDEYIEAYKENFQRFQLLNNAIPKDGIFSTKGACGMDIMVGEYVGGVTISQKGYRAKPSVFPIKEEKDLEKIISDYEYSKVRGKEIQELLFHN